MPKIVELSRHIADLIAAGEVVERPASVVKELLENAFDAGASAVTAEVKNGGVSFIRVTDNGCGIAREDARTAFLRHATSKIRSEEDLSRVGTLGFRGEALAAIAAVSRVDLLTLPGEGTVGTALSLEGGAFVSETDAGCPKGTTIVVRDLFYNTPARQKFLKRNVTEAAHVLAAVQRAALSHPEISVKLIRDGKNELHTPGDSSLMSAVYSVFDRAFALSLLGVRSEYEGIRISGYVTKPSAPRSGRAMQHIFVNGRPIRSRTLSAALEEAFKNSITAGRYPGCVLHLNLDAELVDVNVHPAKAEVKFSNERRAFDAVYFAVKNALEADSGRAPLFAGGAKPPAPAFAVAEPGAQAFFAHTDAETYRNSGDFRTSVPAVPGRDAPDGLRQPEMNAYHTEGTHGPPPAAQNYAEAAAPAVAEAFPDWRILGEAFGTYIIVEQGARLLLIDKHAAHERILYERLRASGERPASQLLMNPALPALSAQEAGALLENLGLLNSLGFEAEDFGGGSLRVRACPGDLDAEDVGPALSELAGKLMENRRAPETEKRELLLSTVACKAAIKAGGRMTAQEREALVRELVSNPEIKFCPHGRPIVLEITRTQLERHFKRS